MTALRSLTALLLALFVAGAGVQDSVLQCRSRNTTHRTCCCTHTLRLPALGDELARAPCCDAAALETAAVPPSSRAAPDFELAEPTRLELGRVALALPAVDERMPALALAPALAATGPPLELRPHVLLI